MSQQELLVRVVRTLDALNVRYMLTGSMVSSLQGEPRSTHDIDMVVALTPPSIKGLLDALPPPEFYLAETAVRESVRRRSMFNLLSPADGDKVDFWILTDSPFDQSRFSRRIVEEVFGIRLFVSSPEDTILAKLSWDKMSGGSQKQFNDALSVYKLQRPTLGIEYLEKWAEELDVVPRWQELQQQADLS